MIENDNRLCRCSKATFRIRSNRSLLQSAVSQRGAFAIPNFLQNVILQEARVGMRPETPLELR